MKHVLLLVERAKSLLSFRVTSRVARNAAAAGCAIVLTVSGCTQDEVVNPQTTLPAREISFRVQGGMPASYATGTTVSFVNAFIVNGFAVRNVASQQDLADVDYIGATDRTQVLDAVTVYRMEGTTNNFDYNPKVYIEEINNGATFVAYSPVSAQITHGLKGNTTNEIKYTVLAPRADGYTAQEDFLVAHTTIYNSAPPLTNTQVTFNFLHALSRIYVKARNRYNSDITITSIALRNLHRSGWLNIDTDGVMPTANDGTADINEAYNSSPTDFTDYKVLWIPADTFEYDYAYILPPLGVTLPAKTDSMKFVVSPEQGMLVLPQTTVIDKDLNGDPDYDGFYLDITYKIGGSTYTAKAQYEDQNSIDRTSYGYGITFEFGRQYALTIDFDGTGKEVSFDVDVEAWNPIVQ